MGDQPTGPFDIPENLAKQWLSSPLNPEWAAEQRRGAALI